MLLQEASFSQHTGGSQTLPGQPVGEPELLTEEAKLKAKRNKLQVSASKRTLSGGQLGFREALRETFTRTYASWTKDWKDRRNGENPGALFQEVNAVKAKTPEQKRREEARKFGNNCFGRLAKHRYFEWTTMVVILMNAMHIGVDTDYSARFYKPDNLYEGPAYFICMELFFAVYFSVELFIRFVGCRRKRLIFRDSWFVFDSFLVFMMDLETFILPFATPGGSPVSSLSILRLLRLLRISRMAKLMKAFPELMLIVKGLVAAARAVAWTLVLLLMIMFVFSILFTSVFHQGWATDEEVEDDIGFYFGSMSKSMFTLVIYGTLLDEVTDCATAIRGSGKIITMLPVFLVFIVLASFMMLNMLLGILVEVVANTAEGEKLAAKNIHVRQAILDTLTTLQGDAEGISRSMWMSIKGRDDVRVNLAELGILNKHHDELAIIGFDSKEVVDGKEYLVTAEDFLNFLFHLQPTEALRLCELQETEKVFVEVRKDVQKRIFALESLVARLTGKEAAEVQGKSGSGKEFRKPSLESCSEKAPPGTKMVACGENASGSIWHSSTGSPPPSLQGGFSKIPVENLMEMLSRLKKTDTGSLVDEIRRRLGLDDLESGAPLEWFDADTQQGFATGIPAANAA